MAQVTVNHTGYFSKEELSYCTAAQQANEQMCDYIAGLWWNETMAQFQSTCREQKQSNPVSNPIRCVFVQADTPGQCGQQADQQSRRHQTC